MKRSSFKFMPHLLLPDISLDYILNIKYKSVVVYYNTNICFFLEKYQRKIWGKKIAN